MCIRDSPIISLGGTADAGDAPATAVNKDRGLELKYYSNGAAASGFMGLDVSDMKYKLYTAATGFATNEVTGTLATLEADTFEADTAFSSPRFELEGSLSYTALGNEFNSTFRAAIE